MKRELFLGRVSPLESNEVRTNSQTSNRVGPIKPRDAVLGFNCFPPRFVQVVERVDGHNLHHEQVLRHPDVVREMEAKYMFFGDEADMARRQIMKGKSCLFDVYYREP